MADTFACSLVTPERELLDVAVEYASLPAWDGLVGVAPQRAPLLAKLGDGPLRLDLPGGEARWFFVGGGFAQMKDNKLTILADEAVEASGIDVEGAQASLKAAEAHVAVGDEQVAKRDREVRRAQQMLHVHELAEN